MYKVVVIDLNLDEVVGPRDQLALELHGLKKGVLLVCLLLQLGLHLGEGTEQETQRLPSCTVTDV